ncbi:molybdopterin-binding protein [Streptomyces sp. 8N706]|uniref:molybdopterin-binding protein n=1 Tax=Streptomyces sp. 8N706 TaxID=3457416 RepID=UPI003FD1D3D2
MTSQDAGRQATTPATGDAVGREAPAAPDALGREGVGRDAVGREDVGREGVRRTAVGPDLADRETVLQEAQDVAKARGVRGVADGDTGDRETADRNIADRDTGDRKTADRNTADRDAVRRDAADRDVDRAVDEALAIVAATSSDRSDRTSSAGATPSSDSPPSCTAAPSGGSACSGADDSSRSSRAAEPPWSVGSSAPGPEAAAPDARSSGPDRRSGHDRPSAGQGRPSAPDRPSGPGTPRRHAHPVTAWPEARERAARAASGPLPTVVRPLEDALGQVLAAPLVAQTDLPSFDTSAMDGWAVAGPGPWRIAAPAGPGVLAGHDEPALLEDGHAVRIATGARVPSGTTAVLRSEHGERRDGPGGHARLYVDADRDVAPGQDIRPRGQECRRGDRLLPTGSLVTPAVLGLAAAAGYDELPTATRPRVQILILGDELLHTGLPRDGRIRDALGPMLGPWLRALGADVVGTQRLGDDADVLHKAVTTSTADLVVTTGGTASGPVDHVHPTLRRAGATLLVDGVAVRPGHPMLLARLAPGRHLVGLPGNPLAAVSGLLTLAEPLLRTLSGRAPYPYATTAPFAADVQGHPRDTRLVPIALRGDRAMPLHFNGPAMLRGIATADGLAVVPPGGAGAGTEAEILELPWPVSPAGTARSSPAHRSDAGPQAGGAAR